MDNHRAAAWCWSQHITPDTRSVFLHIDKHMDAVDAHTEKISCELGAFEVRDVSYWLQHMYNQPGHGERKSVTWDNYIALFIRRYPEVFREVYMCIRQEKMPGLVADRAIHYRHSCKLVSNIRHWLTNDGPWIINIDLDYFWQAWDDKAVQLFSNDYITEIGDSIRICMDEGRVIALTMALSPECCGGWDKAEIVMLTLCEALKCNFNLPD
jgi:hypothetical protein